MDKNKAAAAEPRDGDKKQASTRVPSKRAQRQENTALVRSADLSREQIDLVKRTVAKGATDDELELFLYQCRRLGLDPLSRQIHFVKRGDQATIQVAIDGFRLTAARTGRYRPDEEPPRYAYDDTGKIRSARVRVWLYHERTSAWYPVEAEARFDEYAQRGRDGTLFQSWARMPHVMTSKCAEALAIRKAFPAELSGIYELAEIGESVEPLPFPNSTPQSEVPAPALPAPSTTIAPATSQQRQAIHRVWHSRTRDRFAEHDQRERALDAWLRFATGVESTQALTFDQASQSIAALQQQPVDELVSVATSAMREEVAQ